MIEQVHKVAKFGGTSMAQPNVVADIVGDCQQDIIVVSAPGKNEAEGINIKMTDQLILLASFAIGKTKDKEAFNTLRNEILDRFEGIYYKIDVKKLKSLRGMAKLCLDQICEMPDPTDYAMSLGEELSAQYFTELLKARGISAKYVGAEEWVTFNENGVLAKDETTGKLYEIAEQAADEGQKIVTPGFYGHDSAGNRHLLGRGGSDRTGALAALALARLHRNENVVYENWTDQDGIRTADPRLVEGTNEITELTRGEVREDASGVLHRNTVIDLRNSKIKIILRHTFNTDHPGTSILTERMTDHNKPVAVISGKILNLLTIEDMGMSDTPGYAEAVFAVIREAGISFEHIPAAQDAFSLTFSGVFPEEYLTEIRDKINAAILQVSPNSEAQITTEQKNVVYLVGDLLKNPIIRTSVTGRLCKVMGKNGVLSHIDHHTSPSIAIMLPRDDDIKPYMQLLHDEFIGVSIKLRMKRIIRRAARILK